MSEIAILADHISKQYMIGSEKASYSTLRESIMQTVKAPVRRAAGILRGESYGAADLDETIWALKDISFNVKQGEVVGVIGPNGAGKSTLLKILSRITEPTEGRALIRGRVQSLLEVGTGFHPELTGRENIYLNGSILGMHRDEIDRKFDEIVDFSGIERFLDTPVKHYSSGMYVRLAFSVASHIDTEVLLVDEVLAVGDAAFQEKCLGKMEDVTKQGRTVIFVSHNMAAVNNLCQRGIVLDNGTILFQGSTGDAVNTYLDRNINTGDSGIAKYEPDPSLPVQILEVAVIDQKGNKNNTIRYQDKFQVHLTIDVRESNRDYYSIIYIRDTLGNRVIFTSDTDLEESFVSKIDSGTCRYQLEFPRKILKPGKYYVSANITKKKSSSIDKRESVLSFTIEDNESWRAQNSGYRKDPIIAPEIPWNGHYQKD